MVTLKKNRSFFFSKPQKPVSGHVEIRSVKIGLDYPMPFNSPCRRVFVPGISFPLQSNKKKKPRKKRKKRRPRLSRLRRWARRSLARRFCPRSHEVDPRKDAAGGLRALRAVKPKAVRPLNSKVAAWARDPRLRKRFVKVVRKLLSDLGMRFVGPVPVMILEKMWSHFGEEHFSPHGAACWCVLCRSKGPARMSFLQDVWDSVVTYLVKMPLRVLMSMIVPVPLKTAHFVANKVWQWFKVLFW